MADRGLTFGSIATNRSKRRDLIELISVYLIVLLVLWTPAHGIFPLRGVAAAAVMTITCISFDGLRPMGAACTANLFRSLWVVGARRFNLVAGRADGGTAAHAAFARHAHRMLGPFGYGSMTGPASAAVLQCFFLGAAGRADAPMPPWPQHWRPCCSPWLTCPPIMTLITLFCGLAACLFFLRYRNVYPLAMAHAIIGMAIAITIPGPVLHNMRVGLGYITYTSQPAAIRIRLHSSRRPHCISPLRCTQPGGPHRIHGGMRDSR